mgnify:FL=1
MAKNKTVPAFRIEHICKKRACCKIGSQRTQGQKVRERPFAPAFVCTSCYNEKVKPNKKKAKGYNPNGRKISGKNCKKNTKRNTQCTIS